MRIVRLRASYVSLLIAILITGMAINSGWAAPLAERLSGSNVIRRSTPKDLRNYRPTKTEIVQGAQMGDGFCGYSLEFHESFDDPTSTVVWMAAVDPDACTFEFEIGSFDPIENPPSDEATVATSEAQGTPEDDGERGGGGHEHPNNANSVVDDSSSAGSEEPASGGRNRKLTVVGRWEDLVNIDVNKVLVAVRSHTSGREIVDVDCLSAWWWRDATGWQRPGGDWTGCRYAPNRATALADGHFKNPYFPTCVPDVVHVYYDHLWARVAPRDNLDHGYYDWGIEGTWADGARCKGMLHWARFESIKGEYSTGWIN